MTSERDRMLDHISKLRAALKPFAEIKPSSLYAADGTEMEPYILLLKRDFENPTAFTGLDLALAREAYDYKPGK